MQGPDKECTTGAVKGIKRPRKPKGFKKGSLRSNEGAVLLIFYPLYIMCITLIISL